MLGATVEIVSKPIVKWSAEMKQITSESVEIADAIASVDSNAFVAVDLLKTISSSVIWFLPQGAQIIGTLVDSMKIIKIH